MALVYNLLDPLPSPSPHPHYTGYIYFFVSEELHSVASLVPTLTFFLLFKKYNGLESLVYHSECIDD
jgi:hypothetical protein